MTNGSVDNVLLVTCDSLRYDVWKQMQDALVAGPRLEQTGVSFDRAFATGPGTTPSFPAMLTGTLPLSYGGLGPLTAERPSVAALLGDRGFATAGFHSNPFLSTHFNYDRGFDEFEDYQNPLMGVATTVFPRGIEINNPWLERVDDLINLTGFIKTAYRAVASKPRPYVSAEVITDDSIAWMADADDPFFCWAHYMDVHHPCHPPSEYRAEFGVEHVDIDTVSQLYSRLLDDSASLTDAEMADIRRLYRASIAYVDGQVERLLEALESSGRLDDTLVVFTSDHGELFGEHGRYGKPERMYDELIRVPLVVVNGPTDLSAATDELVSLVDLPPLFHRATGLDVPAEYAGRYPEPGARDHVVAEHEVHGDSIVGVRSDSWLYEIDDILDETRLTDLNSGQVVSPESHDDDELRRVQRVATQRASDVGVDSRLPDDRRLKPDVEARLEDLGYR
ncbi:sulfatase [Halorubrum coriense DSM 10284]|uniref:Sulfatase n=1 Tax=Halorubrum coriense DSM 10284 TaxID=1227466 RepID=M0EJ96_9EURY|nr:sulfatase [Halorubrum coriense]ELZ46957.1 sulfatase [Halorubrum coriense DSM 10284]